MLRRLRLPVLAAAALLAATGCRFWENLTGGKEVTRAAVSLAVKDVLTGKPLAAECGDSAGTWKSTADAGGRLHRGDVPTGYLDLVCEHVFYRKRKVRLDVLKEGNAFEIGMARDGGTSWYQEPDSLAVSVDIVDSTVYGAFKVPGTGYMVRAAPAAETGKLVYRWKARLPRKEKPVPELTHIPSINVVHDTLEGQAGKERIDVVVEARFFGETYVVGTDYVEVDLVRNIPPIVQLHKVEAFRDPITPCRERHLPIAVEISDIDGECKVLRFRSDRRHSSLGNLDMAIRIDTLPDARPAGPKMYQVPVLKLSTDPGLVAPIDNVLEISLVDDNGSEAVTHLEFKTLPNVRPVVRLAPGPGAATASVGKPVAIKVALEDPNNPVENAVIDWKDGAVTDFRHESFPPVNRLDTTLTHVYAAHGDYDVEALTFDPCGDTTRTTLRVRVGRP